MKPFTKKIAAIDAVTLTAILLAVWVFCPPWTRTDTVKVTAIDEGYEIRITSAGRLLLPLGPEGPFPKWSDQTRLLAEGNGEQIEINGLRDKRYSVGKDLQCPWFSSGSIRISEEGRRLVVQGELAHDRQYHIKHSGTYDNITIDHPQILSLLAHAKVEDIDNRYIRARGRFKDGKFDAMGMTFGTNNPPYEPDGSADFEVIGVVAADYYKTAGHDPFSFVISYKKLSPKMK